MLSLQQCHRQIAFRKSISEGTPEPPKKVFVYVQNEGHAFRQIDVSDFPNYDFVGYTYPNSTYPDVIKTST